MGEWLKVEWEEGEGESRGRRRKVDEGSEGCGERGGGGFVEGVF